jgi:hypothetical protein
MRIRSLKISGADEMDFVVSLIDKVSGPAEKAGGSLSSLSGTLMDLVDPAALAVAALGLVAAAAVGLGAAFLGGAAFALKSASELQQMTTQLGVLGTASGMTGEQIVGMLDQLSEKLPQTKDQLAAWAKPLMAAGLQGDKLTTALQATAAAQAMLGDEGVSKFQALQEKIQAAAETGQKLKIPVKGLAALAQAGADVNDIAKRMGITTAQLAAELTKGTVDAAKFGDVLQQSMIDKGAPAIDKMSLSLQSIGEKLKAHISDLFENTDIKPFLVALKDLASVFDQDTASGKFLHTAITTVYNKFFLLASKALPMIKHGFQQVEIGALKIYIAAKPLLSSLARLNKDMGDGSIIGKELGGTWNFMVAGMVANAKVAGFLVDQLEMVIRAIQIISAWADKATGGLGRLGAAMAGAAGGGGLGSIASSVVGTLTGHADGGVVTGVSNGMATVSAAPGEGLASIGKGETILPASSSGGGSGGSGVTINATVNISGASSGAEALEITEEQLSMVLERVALSQGLGQAA